jgi:SCY1-like protein 1
VADAYALGLLIHAVFHPGQAPPSTAQPPPRGNVPSSMFSAWRKLLHPSPRTRMSAQAFLDLGMLLTGGSDAGFFARNPLLQVCQGLDGFNLASDAEKAAFLRYALSLFSSTL